MDAWIACSGRDPLTPFSRPSGLPPVAAMFLDESELVVLATSRFRQSTGRDSFGSPKWVSNSSARNDEAFASARLKSDIATADYPDLGLQLAWILAGTSNTISQFLRFRNASRITPC